MRFGSLFAGIGGMDLGLERAGMQCAWQVEIDDFCRKVLAKHWPNVPKWDDVKTFPPEPVDQWKVDLIAGGFPCQDISKAGKGKGIHGKRSGLWFEFARTIRVLRPALAIVENVPNLLVRDFRSVLNELSISGYDAEWFCLSAGQFRFPQRRTRVFIVAYPCGTRMERLVKAGSSCPSGPWRWRGQEDLLSIARSPFQPSDRWPQPILCGMDDRIPNRVHRLRGLGNAVVPQVAQWIGERIMEAANANPV